MPNKLPVSRLISVTVNLAPQAASQQNLDVLLLLGDTEVIDTTERMRTYASITEVGLDFSTTDPEYLAALNWFGQAPQPSTLMIGRWAQTHSPAQLVGGILSAGQQALSVWTAIASGGFTITIDAGAPQNITGLDFSAVTSLNGVAAVINAALTGADIEWRSNEGRFRIISDVSGAASAVSFASAPGSGTDISDNLVMRAADAASGAYQAPRSAQETAAAAAALFDDRFGQQWYAVVALGADDDDVLALAAFIEAADTKHYHGVTTQAAAVLSSADTTSLFYQLEALAYRKTAGQYSSTDPYAVVSLLARIMTTDYNANNTVIDLMYKQEPGVIAENLSNSQMNALLARQGNVFVEYNNDTAIIEPGNSFSGDPIDLIMGADWLSTDIQTGVYNQLYTSVTKVPQTDAGVQLLTTAIAASCSQGVANGLIAPGTWNSGGFGSLKSGDYMPTGFYIYAQPVAEQAQADREARASPPIQVAVKMAGAIRTVDVQISVNR